MPTNPYSYNVNPAPTSGSGPFGLVPGATSLPNPSADLSGQIPGLSGLNSQAAQTIASKLGGSISPATMNALQNAAATFGVGSGMPGSGLALNKLFGNIAGFTENQAQQGLQDYNSFVPTVSGTQTVSPALQTSVSQSNAQLGAAPSPGASQLYAQQLFNQYLAGYARAGRWDSGANRHAIRWQRHGDGHRAVWCRAFRLPLQPHGHRHDAQSRDPGPVLHDVSRAVRVQHPELGHWRADAAEHRPIRGRGHSRYLRGIRLRREHAFAGSGFTGLFQRSIQPGFYLSRRRINVCH